MPTLDICFSPELLPLFDLKGRVAVVVDVLRATSSIVTALAAGVTHLVPFAELAECRARQFSESSRTPHRSIHV